LGVNSQIANTVIRGSRSPAGPARNAYIMYMAALYAVTHFLSKTLQSSKLHLFYSAHVRSVSFWVVCAIMAKNKVTKNGGESRRRSSTSVSDDVPAERRTSRGGCILYVDTILQPAGRRCGGAAAPNFRTADYYAAGRTPTKMQPALRWCVA